MVFIVKNIHRNIKQEKSSKIIQTMMEYRRCICLNGTFRNGAVRLNWVAKWVVACKRLETTGLGQAITTFIMQTMTK